MKTAGTGFSRYWNLKHPKPKLLNPKPKTPIPEPWPQTVCRRNHHLGNPCVLSLPERLASVHPYPKASYTYVVYTQALKGFPYRYVKPKYTLPWGNAPCTRVFGFLEVLVQVLPYASKDRTVRALDRLKEAIIIRSPEA